MISIFFYVSFFFCYFVSSFFWHTKLCGQFSMVVFFAYTRKWIKMKWIYEHKMPHTTVIVKLWTEKKKKNKQKMSSTQTFALKIHSVKWWLFHGRIMFEKRSFTLLCIYYRDGRLIYDLIYLCVHCISSFQSPVFVQIIWCSRTQSDWNEMKRKWNAFYLLWFLFTF